MIDDSILLYSTINIVGLTLDYLRDAEISTNVERETWELLIDVFCCCFSDHPPL